MNEQRASINRVLVTGATGYIGSSLVKRLVSDGYEVHIVVRENSNLNVLEPVLKCIRVHMYDGSTQGMISLVKTAQPDLVFHLASLFLAQHTSNDIEALIVSNVLFSSQLVEAMVVNGVRNLVNTGTSWQHYENDGYNPVNLYAATKQAFEDVLTYYINAHGLKVTSLILFDTYGPNDPRAKLIALLWKTALSQVPLSMSPGEQQINLVHINDVVQAFMRAAALLSEQDNGHYRYAVATNQPIKLKELAFIFETVTGLTLPIIWGGRSYRPREVMRTWANFDTVPGWQAEVSLESGLLQTRPPVPLNKNCNC